MVGYNVVLGGSKSDLTINNQQHFNSCHIDTLDTHVETTSRHDTIQCGPHFPSSTTIMNIRLIIVGRNIFNSNKVLQ